MNNVLQKIKSGTRNYIEVEFPGTETRIRINVLTNQDVLDASMAADRIFLAAGVDVSMQNIKMYEAEKNLQQLYRACRDTDGKPLAVDVAEFRRMLTVAEKAWLIDRYNELDEQCNPDADTMPDDEFDALVEAVKKNPKALSSVSSTSTLKRLALFLASPPPNLQTGSGLT